MCKDVMRISPSCYYMYVIFAFLFSFLFFFLFYHFSFIIFFHIPDSSSSVTKRYIVVGLSVFTGLYTVIPGLLLTHPDFDEVGRKREKTCGFTKRKGNETRFAI